MPDLVVAGAGMAGLVAAAEARARGAEVLLLEKGDRAGGSMLLSSGMVWRHRSFDDFRTDCPGGDPALQRLLFERLDDDLAWLESLGARVTERGTGNPLTTGVRLDTRSANDACGGDAASGRVVQLGGGKKVLVVPADPQSAGSGGRGQKLAAHARR